MNLDRLFQAGFGIVLAGIAWSVWPHPLAGYYSPQRRQGATYRHGSVVLIDLGHWNESAADWHLGALAQLLGWDGYSVATSRQEFMPELLRTAKVLVVPDAGLHRLAPAHWPAHVGGCHWRE
jgi:hypothetical protein